MKPLIPFLPCTTGLNGIHQWEGARLAWPTKCVICDYVPPRRPLTRNNGIRRAPGVRDALILRDGELCRYCGTTVNLTIEHLIPRCRGGTGSRSNLGIACQTCNNLKGNLTDDEFVGWVLTGEIPFPKEFVEMRRNLKKTKGKREPLRKKYLKFHPEAA